LDVKSTKRSKVVVEVLLLGATKVEKSSSHSAWVHGKSVWVGANHGEDVEEYESDLVVLLGFSWSLA
jgi:hypothetical protein